MTYLLALDQGTSSSRSIVFDAQGQILASAQQEIRQHYPQPGWVEHDPLELWATQRDTARQALAQLQTQGHDLARVRGIGITNQRETVVLWRRDTGQPVARAIVWQDRRTETRCAQWRQQGLERMIRDKTGLSSTLTSRAASWPGCWTMWTAPGRQPSAANWPSAPWTAGCCGT
jgi:glycerol kinase